MATTTGISWTDHTFNPWWGCVKVSAACTHCYAATLAARFGTEWGPKARRRFFGEAHWQEPVRWNHRAEREGVRRRVFCASMADVFERLPEGHPDTAAMDEARSRLWELILGTPHLDWLLLTKRPENIAEMIPTAWADGFPTNVWMGVTAEDQEQADRRIPLLLRLPARVRFVSAEPLLGPVHLTHVALRPGQREGTEVWIDALAGAEFACDAHAEVDVECNRVDWVIVGGESGDGARPMHPDWARNLRNQCQAVGVAFHFKQWGAWAPLRWDTPDSAVGPGTGHPRVHGFDDGTRMTWVGHIPKSQHGRRLDGREWNEFPIAATGRTLAGEAAP